MAAKRAIEAAISGAQVTGNEHQPRASAFEITVDGKVVFSKLQTRGFPADMDDVIQAIQAIVDGGEKEE